MTQNEATEAEMIHHGGTEDTEKAWDWFGEDRGRGESGEELKDLGIG
jgi:hypothetical protein